MRVRRTTVICGHHHDVPADAGTVSLGFGSPSIAGALGEFVLHGADSSITLVQHQQGIELTHVHELGHWLDFTVAGRCLGSAAASDARFDEWLTAVHGTSLYSVLKNAIGGPHGSLVVSKSGLTIDEHLKYLLRTPELWARAYAQWVAVRSGDPVLRGQVANLQTAQYPTQWSDGEFQSVAWAIDNLMRELRWA